MAGTWIVDGHCDSIKVFEAGTRDLGVANEQGHWDLARARQGEVGLQFLAGFIESIYKPERAIRRGLKLIETMHRFCEQNREQVFPVLGKEDLNRVGTDSDPRKLGLLFAIEGGEIIGQDLFMVDIIYRLGIRSLGLTWNQRNALADGVGEKDTGSRLTQLGVEVIGRMNELGMLVDVSHLNEAGFWHVLEVSGQPVAATHSCAKSLCAHPRNLHDQQLRALARQGGVVGVNFYPGFLAESGPVGRHDVVKHIVHIAEVAGTEVIGLGSDFDGIESTPDGLETVTKLPLLVSDLVAAGFSQSEVEGICHQNFMRLLRKVLK